MLEDLRKAKLFFLTSLVFAVLAGGLFFYKVKTINQELGDFVPVLVAKQPIPARTQIEPGMLEIKQIPKKYALNSLLHDSLETAGNMTIVSLEKGDVVTKNMLKQISKMSGEKNRLVNLTQTDRVFFDEELDATDHVDIIVSYQEAEKPVTKLLLSDVPVGRVFDGSEKQKAIGVELSLDDAQKLIFMQNFARQIRVLKHNMANTY